MATELPAPTGLQLDLLCTVERLRQLRDEDAHLAEGTCCVFDRLLTCDLPRLESYLTDDTVAWAKSALEKSGA